MVAEFESDLIRMPHPRGHESRQGKGTPARKAAQAQRDAGRHLVALYRAGEHTVSELEQLFPVTRSTIYRAIARAGGRTALAPARDTAT
jgi:DNA invertase Pin-like site-specific DNA recombinase